MASNLTPPDRVNINGTWYVRRGNNVIKLTTKGH